MSQFQSKLMLTMSVIEYSSQLIAFYILSVLLILTNATFFAFLLHSYCHSLAHIKAWYVPSEYSLCHFSFSYCQSVSVILTFKWWCIISYMSTRQSEIRAVHHWLKTNWTETTLPTCPTHLNCIKIAGWGGLQGWIRAEASCTLRSVRVSGILVDAQKMLR